MSLTNGVSTEDLPAVCRRINAKLTAFLAKPATTERLRSVQQQTKIALMVIAKAVEVYGLDHIAISFNGGKDCLVMLILLLAVLDEYFTHTSEEKSVAFTAESTYPKTSPSLVTASTPPTLLTPAPNTPTSENIPPLSNSTSTSAPPSNYKIQTVYVHSSHPFAEVDSFVAKCVKEYHLNLLRFDESAGMKTAFKVYLNQNSNIKTIFVGTRRTDPHGGLLKHFDMTDGGWPSFMRCHPVIDWHYTEIWGFLRELDIPYCPLYDLGYTSLGGTTDTHPNPALQRSLEGEVPDDASETVERRRSLSVCFRPAYELEADAEERLGRD
ncbi:hypothetical protein ABW19_dt0209154 [Dactylella cylindrospora]|nr:hypothetical protein ABW19_dt0209154 [Dactylella cylindrospora]